VSPSTSLTRGRLRAGDAPPRLSDAWIALAGLSAVFLFEMLDTSVLNVALPTIGRELGSSTTGLQWVSGAYAVSFGGLMLLFGAVSGITRHALHSKRPS
jgi:MFS family permease